MFSLKSSNLQLYIAEQSQIKFVIFVRIEKQHRYMLMLGRRLLFVEKQTFSEFKLLNPFANFKPDIFLLK